MGTVEILNKTAFDTREEWLEDRRKSIGQSEVATALGMNPWQTPLELWAVKTGRLDEPDLSENEAVEWGTRLEGVVCQKYTDVTGRRVFRNELNTFRNSRFPCLHATPDGFLFDTPATPETPGDGVYEGKAVGEFMKDQWLDSTPLQYEIQLQAGMYVMGYEWGSLACLIGGRHFVYRDFLRHAEFEKTALPKLEEFWDCVNMGVEPKFKPDPDSMKVFARLHPKDNGETIELPDSLYLDKMRESYIAAIKRNEGAKDEIDAKIKLLIGDNSYGLLPNGVRYSWKHQSRKGHVVEPSESRVLRRLKAKGE